MTLVARFGLDSTANQVVSGQIDGSSPPAPAASGLVFVCTTAGGVYSLNSLYRSNGTAWVETNVIDGLMISVVDDLTGGMSEFKAYSAYLWNDNDSTWERIGFDEDDILTSHSGDVLVSSEGNVILSG